MITACKRGHIDLIITKSLSRFARNTVDCLETVRLLKANGIGVYFEKENINTLTESSEFLITLFSGFAQAESESLSKNVAWGKAKSAEAGKVTFQYKKMLGYRKGADGQPEIVPEEAEVIKRIYHRYLDGCTLGQIKRELDEDNVPTAQGVEFWSPAIIHNILTNEKYIGDALLQKTYVTDCISKKVKKNQGERAMYYVENNHPAIISREMFDQVRNEMTRRSSKRKVLQKSGKTELGKYSGKYALTELLVCGECGSPYKRVTWARNGKKRIVWRCVSRLEFGTQYCHNSPTLDESKLHSAILASMNEFAVIRQEGCPDVLAMAEEAKQALSQAGQKGHCGGAGRFWLCVGRQRRRAQAAGLAAQAPLHDSVSGRQPRKLRPAGTVPGDGAVRRQGAEPWRQRVPCVPGQCAGAGRQDLSLLWWRGKSG